MRMLVTGASGNVGRALIAQCKAAKTDVVCAVTSPEKVGGDQLFSGLSVVPLDFRRAEAFEAPSGIDSVFLLRPPEIADPEVFLRFLGRFLPRRPHVIFLSLQGAEGKKYTPHYKIERAIAEGGWSYTFVRPGYFMENLLSTLRQELLASGRVFLPSGGLKFNWVSVDDVAAVVHRVAMEPERFRGRSLAVTGGEQLSFAEVCGLLSARIGSPFEYANPSVLRYLARELLRGTSPRFLLVMLLIHWLPKFSAPEPLADTVAELLGRRPVGLAEFIDRNREQLARGSRAA